PDPEPAPEPDPEPAPEPDPEPEPEPEDEFEELVARIVAIILELFGFDPDEDDNTPAVDDDVIEQLETAETLLTDLLPVIEPEDDDFETETSSQTDEMEMMM
ncbi:MAG: hypothetical protein AAFN09_05520, partial [Pseudomonadota bacterium]